MKRPVVLLCSMVLFLAPARADSDPTVAQVLGLLDGALQSITSFDVRVDCSRKFLLKTEAVQELSPGKKRLIVKDIRKLRSGEQPQIFKKKYRQIFQEGKGRVEVLDVDGKKTAEITIYDGESQKSYRPAQKEALICHTITRLIEEGWDYREAYQTVYGDFGILTCFRERKYNTTVREDPDSPSLVVLESPPDPNAHNKISYQQEGFRVFLDKNRGFLPAILESIKIIKGRPFTYRRLTVEEWKDLGGKVWVPVRARIQFYQQNPDFPTFGEVDSDGEMVVDLARSSWNKPLADSNFTLAMPIGTKVIDTLRQVQFVTGKADPGTNLDDLAANARHIVPYPVQKPPPVEQDSPWMWILSGSAACLGALVLWFSVRFLRKYRSKQVT